MSSPLFSGNQQRCAQMTSSKGIKVPPFAGWPIRLARGVLAAFFLQLSLVKQHFGSRNRQRFKRNLNSDIVVNQSGSVVESLLIR
jgi:hypothetical protein